MSFIPNIGKLTTSIKKTKMFQIVNNKRIKFKNWILHSFENTYRAVISLSLLVCTAVMMGIVHYLFPLVPWVGCGILSLAATVILAEVLGLLLRIFFGVKKRNRIYWFLQFAFIMLCCVIAGQGYHIGSSVLFSLAVTMMVALFGRCLWAILMNKKHTILVIVSLIITTVGLGATAVLLKSEGFKNTYVADYLLMAEERSSVSKEAGQLKKAEQEPFKVAYLTYGTDSSVDWMSKTTDMTAFMERGFPVGMSMKKHFGYDLDKVPLEGKVWYPVEKKECPVLFIVHGNHDFVTDSYLGYDYLGGYLASCGYVVISVNENSCNRLNHENDGRAVLLLENMKYIFELNRDQNSEWYQKIDESKVAIAGHSRGGEAVSEAYLFNDYDSYPEDGNVKFDYHYNIKSVIAIAPTVDQYQPAEHEVSIQDVNYLCLIGANDHDVSIAMGQKQYDHVSFTQNGDYLKSFVYIADANHGQFNSEWGRYDYGYPVNDFLNVANLMEESAQQEVLKTFVKTFLDVTLVGDKTDQALLTDCQKYAKSLPKTIYQQVYKTSNFQCISSFEEDSNLNTATMEGATIEAVNTDKWKEVKTRFGDSSTRDNYVLQLEWKDTKEAQISFSTPEINLSEKNVVFDLADMREEKSQNPELLDGEVILSDASGHTTSVRISDHTIVYPSLPVQLRKLDYVFGDYEYKHQFQTVTVPEEAFTRGNSSFDPTRIVKLTIAMNTNDAGKIQLDNVGLEE